MSDVEELLKRAEEWLIKPSVGIFDESHSLIRDLANHINSGGWRPISEYERPKNDDGEKVLLGHWVDYGKEEYYFGAPNWMWIASGSMSYDIKGELMFWIDKDDDFMPFSKDFNNVTHFMPLPSPPVDNKEPNND